MTLARDRRRVPAEENILRYVSLTGYDPDTGVVNGNAFERKPKDKNGLSVIRRGVFSSESDSDVAAIRFVSGKWLTIKKSGRFAELNVGGFYGAISQLERDVSDVAVVEDPLAPEDDKPANPAHALIIGLPFKGEAVGSLTSELVGDLIRKAVLRLHEAVPD